MSSFPRTCLAALLVLVGAAQAAAITVVLDELFVNAGDDTTFTSDDTTPGSGTTSYTKTISFSHAPTAVSFDVELQVDASAGTGGSFHFANSGHIGMNFDGSETGQGRGINQAGEAVTYTVSSITQTGTTPTSFSFDGFTEVNLRFAEGGFDAGQITDGASTLFAFDNSDGTAEVTVATNGDPFPVDLSTPMPSTVVAEWVAASPGGGNNVWRVNTIKGQFTFDADVIIPGDTDGDGVVEPATVGALGDDLGPIVANFFNQEDVRANGDLVDDGIVDFLDFKEWKDNVPGGVSAPVLDYVASLMAVPEPTSGLLSLFAVFVFSSSSRSALRRGNATSC